MKYGLFLLLMMLSLLAAAQTVHVKDGEIHYKGKVAAKGLDQTTINNRLAAAVSRLFGLVTTAPDSKGTSLNGHSTLTLKTPYPVIKKVHYTYHLQAQKEGYSYVLDSFYLVTRRRGERADTTSSADLYEGMEESGARSIETEAVLNEIDMRVQRVLALLQRAVQASTK